VLTDVERARALIGLAHPDFRDDLARADPLRQTAPS
jgi:acyl-CoA hydrolase